MIDSIFVKWTLTVIFGAAGLTFFMVKAGTPSPATVADRLSRVTHVVGCAAMILASWSWGSKLPVWPQEAAFTLAAGWFFVRAVHGPLDRTQSHGSRWHDFHHAAMAGAVTWSIAVMTDPHTLGGHPASARPAPAVSPADGLTAAVLTVYFVVAAWPWLSVALRAVRKSNHHELGKRRPAVEAASHGVMSIGMAAMFLAMA